MHPLFLVVGSPAVGKSTTSRALAAKFPKSLHIPVDNLRDLVVSGTVLPSPDWSNDLIQQLSLARETAIQMALKYHQAGFVTVIDDFWDPYHLADYKPLFALPHIQKVVLYPSQHEAHQRNFQRSGTSPVRDYIDEGIRLIYHHLNAAAGQLEQDGWLVVDTTYLSVEATVAQILQHQRKVDHNAIDLLGTAVYRDYGDNIVASAG